MPESLIGKQLDNYTIEQLLGRGGMSEVYLGRDVNLNRKVAIKVVDSRHRGDPAYSERFIREAQSIANLNHEHIIKIFHFSTSDTLSFFAMEYIEGRDLASVITTYKYRELLMPYQEVLHVIHQLAKALDAAHEQGVVHRDIKPSNVMIEDASQRIVLMDFGLVLEMGRGTLGKVFGSAQYIAPEQAMNSANAVPQSDLYSVGVMLFEMLTGELPFTASSAALMAMKHVNDVPPSPREFNPNLPREIDSFFDRILAKNPNDRFQSAMVLYEHLDRVLKIAASTHGDMSRLTLPNRLNPLGHMPTEDEFTPPKTPPSIPSPTSAQSLYDQETYQGGAPTPPVQPQHEYTPPPSPTPLYDHFENKKGKQVGIIGLGIGLIIIALIVLVGVGVLVLGGGDDDDNAKQAGDGNNATLTQAVIQPTATETVEIAPTNTEMETPVSPEPTNTPMPTETLAEAVVIPTIEIIQDSTETPTEVTPTEAPTATATFRPVELSMIVVTLTQTATQVPSPTELPSITPSETSTATEIPSNTPLPPPPTVAPTFTFTPAGPSATPEGHQIRLFYDENSFYLWNPSQPQLPVEPFTFEPLDSSGFPTDRRFEGLAWTQFYGFVEVNACVSLEITQAPTWLRPRQCRYHNSLLLPPRSSELVFWIQDGGAVEFRVLWEGEEIARCPITGDAQECDIYVPE